MNNNNNSVRKVTEAVCTITRPRARLCVYVCMCVRVFVCVKVTDMMMRACLGAPHLSTFSICQSDSGCLQLTLTKKPQLAWLGKQLNMGQNIVSKKFLGIESDLKDGNTQDLGNAGEIHKTNFNVYSPCDFEHLLAHIASLHVSACTHVASNYKVNI